MSLDLVEFSMEFVNLARKFAPQYPGVSPKLFSSRQSIAISNLGTTRILRKNEALGTKDLVTLAVITTPPEAQKFAEFIALRVIYGDEASYFDDSYHPPVTDSAGGEAAKPVSRKQLTAQQLLLQEIVDFLQLESSVNTKKDLKHHQFADQVEQELFTPFDVNRASNEELLLRARKRVAFEIINGREGILNSHLSDWLGIFESAKQIIIQNIPSMSSELLIRSQLLGYADEVTSLTREQFIETVANLLVASSLSDEKELQQELEEGLSEFSRHQLSTTYDTMSKYQELLQRFHVPESFYAPLLQTIIDELKKRLNEDVHSLDDILAHPEVFNNREWSRDELQELLSNTMEHTNPLDMLQKAAEFDELLQTNLSDQIAEQMSKQLNSMSLSDLMKQPTMSPQWLKAMEEKTQSQLGKNAYDESDQLFDSLDALKNEISNQFARRSLQNLQQDIGTDMAENALSFEDLQNAVQKASQSKAPLSIEAIKNAAERLGLSQMELSTLLGDFMNYLKELMENGEASFERVDNILQSKDISESQFDELLSEGYETESSGMIGALANRNLMKTLNESRNHPNGKQTLEEGLAAGGGENLLQEWFNTGSRIPADLRDIVKRVAKRIMIDLAKAKASQLIGSSEAGPLPEGSIRPYFMGDEPDAIDLDESLDNILSMGKQLNDVEMGDFIVRKMVSGRRCVIFLIDISGSMEGPPLASASLAAAMLMFAFGKDELGLALFESNTHVVCEIDEHREIDEVVDQVLDLEAKGGTQMQAALEWAVGQLEHSTSEDKIMVMVTDAMIGDFYRCESHLRGIADMGASAILIMPEIGRGMGQINNLLESSNGQLVTVKKWKDFPEIVSEVLRRT